ncbi:MAG: acyl-CoA dehydrogenase [Thermoanaerobaculia bacterium]
MRDTLIDDRTVDFLLWDVLDAGALLALPPFAEHDRATLGAYVDLCRRFAREVLLPTYKLLDAEPPVFDGERVRVHPRLHEVWPRLKELGIIAASRPFDVGGQQLPFTVSLAGTLYVMAGNCPVYSYAGLTTGAAHLVEAFGSEDLKGRYLPLLHEGTWTGTMALTEPQAGSSLSDVATTATPSGGHYLVSGSKMFISGGDHDLAENIVHMVLARIPGAPAGVKGISLFLVPKLRPEGKALVPNDVRVTGLIHKMGWRALPATALSFGEAGDCRGFLVGEPNRGLAYMFQMMNEARVIVGADAVASASAAYRQSLAYALERPQGRPLASKDPAQPQVPIVEHADVRRMLLRQKSIVEGGLALLLQVAKLADLAEHAPEPAERQRAQLLLDLLTPVAKTFPAERGFEANALAVQVHGGYGYSTEYSPEAYLRDQKLNSIHEGTTGIQGLDLLGRKVTAAKGAALGALAAEVSAACARAGEAGVDPSWIAAVREAGTKVGALTKELGAKGVAGDVEAMLLHATDYLDLFSTWVVAWQWLNVAAAAREALARGSAPEPFCRGKLAAAQYFIRTELPRVDHLAALCRDGEDSYARARPDWF